MLQMLWEQRSGEKRISRMLAKKLEEGETDFTPELLQQFAAMANTMFGTKWKRDWAVNDLDYNPIWNVDGTETETTTRTPNLTTETQRTPELSEETTRTPNLTETSVRTPDLHHEDTRTPNLSESSTRTPDLSTTETRTPDLSKNETRTPNLSEATKYGKTDTKSFTNRHDIETTTPELTRKVMANDGYTETETEKVPGYTDQRNVTARDRDEYMYGFNATVAQPSTETKEKEEVKDVRTAGDPGEKKLTVTGSKSETLERVSGGDGKKDTEYTGSESNAESGTDTKTTSGTETTKITESGTEKTTTAESGTEKTTTTTSGTETTTGSETGTDTTETRTKGTETIAVNTTGKEVTNTQQTGTETIEMTKTRGGNIGVTMTQQLLAAERDSNAWLFFEHVLQDLDDLFTISVYF